MVIASILCFIFLTAVSGGNPFALTKENMILWPLVIGFVIYSAVSSYRETERCTYETLMFCTNTANKVEVEWHNALDARSPASMSKRRLHGGG